MPVAESVRSGSGTSEAAWGAILHVLCLDCVMEDYAQLGGEQNAQRPAGYAKRKQGFEKGCQPPRVRQ